ncbi:dipeptidyl aminopeptidase [Leifsonia sp. F6_8S_P_1B]|uniref:Dipeptidyl aminopeptidase n=1 Tax=Leifsonia williamsii TaxID=3035919 RepID=A0ABT8K919_9MICO|nr:dipeptidyl aminopeptidase [Leifsonia williamsii]MDN4613956.1 dipeptidyl aminopeptidase [Leifsonia williamsii]
MSHASSAFATGFSPNPDFDFDLRVVLGSAVERAADPGEVLAATAAVHKGDHPGWFAAWRDLGRRAKAVGDTASAAGHRVSAAEAYLRAANYFGVAVNAVSGLKDESELLPAFQATREAWEAFVAHTSANVETVAIPYEGTTLPGWFFRAPAESAQGDSAPTLVTVNGSDGSLAALWAASGAPALRRGYNVLLFDGPGQQSMLFERGVPFRPDWEKVLTPVYDAVAGYDGVDASRIAVYGISQAGYWVSRALAFEHRFAAGIVDPGVVDVSASWTAHMPKNMIRLLDEGEDEKFDRDMAMGMKFSTELSSTWQFRARPYGTTGYAETLEAVRQYTVEEVAAQITTPLLITSPEDEQFWPGQPERLAELTSGVSTLLPFTAAEGANYHCEPLARGLTAQCMFDWLDERVGR